MTSIYYNDARKAIADQLRLEIYVESYGSISCRCSQQAFFEEMTVNLAEIREQGED